MVSKKRESIVKMLTNVPLKESQGKYLYSHKKIDLKKYTFFKLTSIMFDEKFPQSEAIENIISIVANERCSFIYLLKGTPESVTIYIGIAISQTEVGMSSIKYAHKLKAVFNGYFYGSELELLNAHAIEQELFSNMDRYMQGSVMLGVPSIQKSAVQKNLNFQGVDRLINSVGEGHWMLVVIAEGVVQERITAFKDTAYSLYDTLHLESKKNIQSSESETKGTSTSQSKSFTKAKGTSAGKNIVINRDCGDSENNGKSINDSNTSGENTGSSYSKSISLANTVEQIDKRASMLMNYMDDVIFKRLKIAQAKGFYKTSVFLLGDTKSNHERLKSSMLAIYQGDEASENPLRNYPLNKESIDQIVKHIQTFEPLAVDVPSNEELAVLYSLPIRKNATELATYLTSQELSYIAGLPQKEIVGVQLNEGVDFGLNVKNSNDLSAIELGRIVNRGQVRESNVVKLNAKQINKHIFIAGVTGSGKTTTCQKLLTSSGLPFLVIEPAKTEYRGMAKDMDDLVIYTLGNEQLSPFRLNPFELLKGESITSHIDMLKATFTAAFPMEAAMPQILEEAMYECYKDCGWDIEENRNIHLKNPSKSNGEYFPTLEMLVSRLKSVVEKQGFGNELRDNYIGSLVSRLKNLTIGAKGLMLNCKLSIDFEKLLDQRVIIEMEDIKSSEDKALLMGLILSRLSEALKLKHRKNPSYKHITLVEEAHRLLSKVDFGDTPTKKTAVETFSDMLAEVRKYGEGLVIVDQIPNKLASEVLKNTNTKIIHRIFARDDKEVIGDTMMMDSKQKEFLSSLPVGQAILFSEGMHKPVVVAVRATTDTSDNEISEVVLKKLGERNKQTMPRVYYPLSSILKLPINEERNIKQLLEKGLIFFTKHSNMDSMYQAYDKMQEELIPLKEKTGFTDQRILEVLIYYKHFKTHEFIKLNYDFTRFSKDAKVLYEIFKNRTLDEESQFTIPEIQYYL
ncbi:hypothetical protein QI30_08470 [Kurthia sp. 3B1D]|uniref:Helicase HerA central domain-containing protein n=1 Tax=Candidatus Kurthia intestinigallinarum TaxID=1562256 RepID=A0A433RUJ3_9BACL|nr:DUF87 domain-containing protein [Kurthia sp. 3B1D]RUS56950.1 hypothetical protein QI30_08470 [Kurthia sp. 3B1D]